MKNGLILPCSSKACAHYRLLRPAAAYAYHRKALVSRATNGAGSVHEFGARRFDAVFGQREPGYGDYMLEWREAFPNIPFIYDFDDLLWQPHPQSPFKPGPDYLAGIDKQASVASTVTVSTVDMGDAVKERYGIDPVVLPNLMGKQDFRPIRGKSGKLRILWAGSKTHLPDLEQVIPVVLETADRFEWVFFGDCPEVLKGKVEFHDVVPFHRYLSTLYELKCHVGIAPLEPNRFNDCKSNLKLLEYGALGMATVATNTGPYKNSYGYLVDYNDQDGWITQLTRLEKDTRWRKNVNASRSYAESFMLERNIDKILSVYDEALAWRGN